MIDYKKVDPRPNVVFFTLNFFKQNYKLISLLFLLTITIQIVLTYIGSYIGGDSDFLKLFTSGKTPSTQEILGAFTFRFVLNQVYTAFVLILITVVVSIIFKVLFDIIKLKQPNKPIYNFTDLKLNVPTQSILSALSDLFVRKETFILTLKVVWLSVVYLLLSFVISIVLIYLTVILGLSYIFPLTFAILFGYIVISLPAIITGLVIFNFNGTFGQYWQDLKAVFGRYGSDVFNYLVFVAVVRITLSMVLIFLIAFVTYVISFVGLSSLSNFINTAIIRYVSGFLSLILIMTGFFVVAFYNDAKAKANDGFISVN